MAMPKNQLSPPKNGVSLGRCITADISEGVRQNLRTSHCAYVKVGHILTVYHRSKEVTAVRVWIDVSLQIYLCE